MGHYQSISTYYHIVAIPWLEHKVIRLQWCSRQPDLFTSSNHRCKFYRLSSRATLIYHHLPFSFVFWMIFFRMTQTKTWGTRHGAGSEFSRGSGLPWRYSVHFWALCPMSSMSDCWRLCFDGLHKDMYFFPVFLCVSWVWGIFNGVKVIKIYRLSKVYSCFLLLFFNIITYMHTHT